MQFNSFEYVLLFLPTVVASYYLFRTSKVSKYIIFIASCIFYGWEQPWFLLPMFASASVDYAIANKIGTTSDPRARRLLLVVSILFSLTLLCVFKYTGWISKGLTALGLIASPISLPLPPGISFYTFETISYSIDVFRGEVTPRRKPLDYLTFIVFFPHLVAGPIRRARELLPALSHIRPPISWETAGQAMFYVLWGLVLKVALADNFGGIVQNIMQRLAKPDGLKPGLGFVFAYAFAFQIYADFAAYSFIARGSALLFGVDVNRNFLTPYFSRNASDFWQRWHISLSTWLRDYLYIPLGGNRSGTAITLRNLLIVMTLGGLWHGAGVFFVLWGLWQGFLLIFYRLCPIDAWLCKALPRPIGQVVATLLFFHLVCFGWILFRCDTSTFLPIIKSCLETRLVDVLPWSSHWLFHYGGPDQAVGWWLLCFAVPLLATDWLGFRSRCEFPDLWTSMPLVAQVVTLVAMFYGVVFFAARQANEFIYFAF